MRAIVVLLAALLLAPAAASAAAPAASWSELVESLESGDAATAQKVYADDFHATFAALDAALDARASGALANASASEVQSELAQKTILHLSYLAAKDDPAYLDVLESGFGEEVTLDNALRVFAAHAADEMRASLAEWDDETERHVAAVEALAYSGPLDVGDEVEEYYEAVEANDKAAAEEAAEHALPLLDRLSGAARVESRGLQTLIETANVLAAEYDEYVKDGKVLDQEAYDEKVKDLFLPALERSWEDVEAETTSEHPAEGRAIGAAVASLHEKVLALAPNAEVRALVATIVAEAQEASGATVEIGSVGAFSEGAHALHEALEAIVAAHAAGARERALDLAEDAYLQIYAPKLEARVLAASPALNGDIERLLNQDLRAALQRGASVSDVEAIAYEIDEKVEQAGEISAQGASAGKSFFDSFLIIVREGFEAMLVVGALVTYTMRTGHKDKAKLLYYGAGAGLVATFALFFAVRWVFATLPVNREVLEGATTLLAVAVLFYVSYWLINKVETAKWNRFVQGKMKGALLKGSAVTLVGIAFLAVFREGFETVLFYQGLYTGAAHGVAITLGAALGLVVLVAAMLAFYRFGVTLPLRPFFIATSALLYYLAIAFMGAGIHELQEAGVVPTTVLPGVSALVDLPVVSTVAEFLGVYPTVETLAAQAVLVAAIVGGLAYAFVLEPRRQARDVDAVEA